MKFPASYTVSWALLQSIGGTFLHVQDKNMCFSPKRVGSNSTQGSNETTFSLGKALANNPQDFLEKSSSTSATYLRDQLRGSRIEWPKGKDRFFVPHDALERLITKPKIQVELGHHKNVNLLERRLLTDEILTKAKRLFAILVLLEKGHLIGEFLRENLADADLPFQRSNSANLSGTYKLCRKNESNPIHCMLDWDTTSIIEFSREQRCMQAPIFEIGQRYEFDDNCVLPFTLDEMDTGKAKEGGFGTVWKVDIHPAHHKFEMDKESKGFTNSFALKKLHSKSKEEFEVEVAVHIAFSLQPHPNLIRLLCTFSYKQEYYLLFPYAKSNLRQFWRQNPRPDFSKSSVLWMLEQCKAIVSALHKIHEYRNTQEPLPHFEEYERVYGRNGDIKPENILLSPEVDKKPEYNADPGALLIADFGLTYLHRRLTRSFIVSDKINGSPSYEPPERALCKVITRKYDIWSLGCLFLELLIWRLRGWQKLTYFNRVRYLTSREGRGDQKYYDIVKTKNSGSEPKAIVRRSVQQWIEDLRGDPNCSELVRDLLDLISQGMLVVGVSERMSCVEIAKDDEESRGRSGVFDKR
ncbi:hypothetical protein HYALB_00005900 [Hymenoscyphus albidus]|uniref:Protein kinase domain-containing protein n=1 Tax=Hymenoscyphus albidus TaxID=595503 RepID=A0A9N9Q7S9_9HELO|nr:hypothetical protein HYALB_00005900 [Hymenoscyphus albidus]